MAFKCMPEEYLLDIYYVKYHLSICSENVNRIFEEPFWYICKKDDSIWGGQGIRHKYFALIMINLSRSNVNETEEKTDDKTNNFPLNLFVCYTMWLNLTWFHKTLDFYIKLIVTTNSVFSSSVMIIIVVFDSFSYLKKI